MTREDVVTRIRAFLQGKLPRNEAATVRKAIQDDASLLRILDGAYSLELSQPEQTERLVRSIAKHSSIKEALDAILEEEDGEET